MNTPSLQALIIDHQLGELSPEVAELLETHLAQNAEARAEAERLKQTISVTQQTVLRHPELARVEPGNAETPQRAAPHHLGAGWLAKAAGIALLVGLAGAGGYFAARQAPRAPGAAAVTAPTATPPIPLKESPWARYRIAAGAAGLEVVRIESSTAGPR